MNVLMRACFGHRYAGETSTSEGGTHSGQELLDRAVLAVNYGQHYGLVGRNGVGKSSLLRAISQRYIEGIPKFMHIVHVEQECVGDDRTA